MGLTVAERQLAGPNLGSMNASRHARDYRQRRYRRATRLPLARAKVMMRPNSSDKASRASLRLRDRCGRTRWKGVVIMGKALDLPDPLESASNKPLGNADGLLAQMAGEE